MTLPERDRAAIAATYVDVLQQVEAMRAVMRAAAEDYPVEQFPRNGTYINCIDSALGGVAAMAELSLEKVGDEVPQSDESIANLRAYLGQE